MLDRAEEAAVEFLRHACQVCRKTPASRTPGLFRTSPWLASALRRQRRDDSTWHRTAGRRLLKRARKAAQKAVKVARKFQTDLPHALREAGLIAAMRGSSRKCRRHLDESLAVAQRQGAAFRTCPNLAGSRPCRQGIRLAGRPGRSDDCPPGAARAGGGFRTRRSQRTGSCRARQDGGLEVPTQSIGRRLR